jgi:sugar phosphate isomerase/epimerase
MTTSYLSRRDFLRSAAMSVAVISAPQVLSAAATGGAPAWTIGCLNRPWVKWSADEMLDGVKAAGYRVVGLQTPTPADPFVGSTATPAYLAALKQKIAARGLTATMGRLRTMDNADFAKATADIRKQVDNAVALGLGTLINTGTNKPELYNPWYRLMAFGAAYTADHGIKLVTKPHGGVNAAAKELQTCLEQIKHPNLGIWYDAGNIIFYTGKDPLAELEPILSHVTAFTAKDCAAKGADVMIQFGEGKVDFSAIFRRLKKARFNGPIMVESGAIGETAAATTANAKANRVFLEKTLAAI